MKRTRIKMCGTTNMADAHAAVEAGVDALGFIFFLKSPRNISVEDAGVIISQLPPFIDSVGVFVDEDLENILKTVITTGLNHVQLHGRESTDYCKLLKTKLPWIKVLKAFRVGDDHLEKELIYSYDNVIDGFLFDTYTKGQEGGTGHIFNWDLLDQLEVTKPIILAGGLTPDNAATAVKRVVPYGIDINSGVELSPGKKNHEALQSLINNVRAC